MFLFSFVSFNLLVVLKSPSNIPFKGLIVQALDPETGKSIFDFFFISSFFDFNYLFISLNKTKKSILAIGKFSQGTGLKVIDSCSAVTHSDNRLVKFFFL